MRPNRRGARFGFPVFSLNYYCQKILQFGLSLLLIRETETVCNKIKQRAPDYRLKAIKKQAKG